MDILFVCTHNRCRSILAEAICNQLGNPRLRAHSAGTAPAGEVHPLTLHYLAQAGIDTAGLASKSWEALGELAPDLVITVCDSAAGEACPLVPKGATTFHWGLPDPSRITGDEARQREAFLAVMRCLRSRLQALGESRFQSADAAGLRGILTRIAQQFPAPILDNKER